MVQREKEGCLMDNLSNIIRKKVLEARPSLKESNWAEMEALLDQTAGKSGGYWTGSRWIWLGIFMIFCLGGGAVFYMQVEPSPLVVLASPTKFNKPGEPKALVKKQVSSFQIPKSEPNTVLHEFHPPSKALTDNITNTSIHKDTLVHKHIFRSSSEGSDPDDSDQKLPNIHHNSFVAQRMISNSYKDISLNKLPLRSPLFIPYKKKPLWNRIKDVNEIHSLPSTLTISAEHLLKNHVHNRRKRASQKKYPFRKNYISIHGNTMNVRAHSVRGTAGFVPKNLYPGAGISYTRRINGSTDFGLRLDMEDIWFRPWFENVEHSFLDIWGINRDARLFLRRHLRPHMIYRFRPYWSVSSGLTYWKLNASHGQILQIPDAVGNPHSTEDMKFFRLPGNQINNYIEGTIYQEMSFLGPIERQLNWSSSVGLGIDIRLFRAVFLNWETAIHYNIPLNHFKWNVPIESITGQEVHSFGYPAYTRTSFGISFGF